jgi:hypothetical protein
MKKFLIALGTIFGGILIVIIIIAAIFIPHALKLDKDATAYLQDALPKIVSSWDAQALMERATPELLSSLKSSSDLDRLFTMFRQLGGLKYLDTPKGNITSATLTKQGSFTVGNYIAQAEFERGKASISVQLRRSGNSWQINGFHVTSDAFLPPKT